ncbi:IclR family transcriptional regulator [Microbacterium sp. MAHUQ-60]|uniref:IclR family transcriptional regulator n=1 Tax=unclassified Microbacterium TaxID=2609290 RepID=UPI003620A9E9
MNHSTALKTPPSYAIASVDHALRLALVLQVEGSLTVAAAAERLGVARSTAHRLLQMLVYRDYARQDEARAYRPGPVLELTSHSPSRAAELRKASLPYLRRLSAIFGESINVSIRTGDTARFIASVESERAVRVTSREGMVFPLHRTTTGMLYLGSRPDLDVKRYLDRNSTKGQDLWRRLRPDIDRVRRCGYALNHHRSEHGLVAIGVSILRPGDELFAGLSVSLPTIRFDETQIDRYVSVLHSTSIQLADALRTVEGSVALAG